MALGEYVSVSQQADSERADVETERRAQEAGPAVRAQELQELVDIYIGRGLSPALAREVAEALTEEDAVRAHARDELGIDIDDHPDPWLAAIASMVRRCLCLCVRVNCKRTSGPRRWHGECGSVPRSQRVRQSSKMKIHMDSMCQCGSVPPVSLCVCALDGIPGRRRFAPTARAGRLCVSFCVIL